MKREQEKIEENLREHAMILVDANFLLLLRCPVCDEKFEVIEPRRDRADVATKHRDRRHLERNKTRLATLNGTKAKVDT